MEADLRPATDNQACNGISPVIIVVAESLGFYVPVLQRYGKKRGATFVHDELDFGAVGSKGGVEECRIQDFHGLFIWCLHSQ